MDTAQWPQGGIGVVKNGVENPKNTEKKPRPQKEQALNCPRCSSTNTKFCYYNNYSLAQPRYFCKTCRRYWTEGGSLRNVPVGGGSRKNKRSSSSSSTSSSTSSNSSRKVVFPSDLNPQNPKIHEGQDLNLAYNPCHYTPGMPEFVALPFGLDSKINQNSNASNHHHHHHHPHVPAMELFKTGNMMMSSGGMSCLMSNTPVSQVFSSSSSGFDFKPSTVGFSIDGLENYGSMNQGVEDHTNSSRILFPLEELKPVSNGDEFGQQDRVVQGSEANNGYWNGMLAGGSW